MEIRAPLSTNITLCNICLQDSMKDGCSHGMREGKEKINICGECFGKAEIECNTRSPDWPPYWYFKERCASPQKTSAVVRKYKKAAIAALN